MVSHRAKFLQFGQYKELIYLGDLLRFCQGSPWLSGNMLDWIQEVQGLMLSCVISTFTINYINYVLDVCAWKITKFAAYLLFVCMVI